MSSAIKYYHIFTVEHRACRSLTFSAYVEAGSDRPFDDDVELECPLCGQKFQAFVSSTIITTHRPEQLLVAQKVWH